MAARTRPRCHRHAELYYLDPEGAMMAAPVTITGSTLESGAPMRLFPTRIVGGGLETPGRHYDVACDGRFLINTLLKDGSVLTPAGNFGRTYDVAPDGQRFVVLKEASDSGAVPQQLVVIQHFDELLKRLVPTRLSPTQ